MLQKNLISLVIGTAIALATPIVAQAQFPLPQAPPPVQQEQSQITQIEADAVAEILELLTPDQQKQYKTARRRGAGIIQGLEEVQDISEKQQREINSIIRKTSRRIIDATRQR